MPITKNRKHLYPENWKEISTWTRIRAGNKCEICHAENGKPNPVTGSKVVLTVHHCDFNPQNNIEHNLLALCQLCHNRIDRKFRDYNRRKKQ